VFSSSNNNNKRMLEATISTNKFDNEWYSFWRWQETCGCRV
jgi:hypothetical protein